MTESPITRETVLNERLPAAVQVSRMEVRRITIAPSTAGGAHIHNGAVFGSIESGSAVFQIDDKPEVTLRTGDVFYEPANVTISRFDATSEGVTFLGYFLLEESQSPEIVFLAE